MEKELRISEENYKTVISYTERIETCGKVVRYGLEDPDGLWDLGNETFSEIVENMSIAAGVIREILETAAKETENPKRAELREV